MRIIHELIVIVDLTWEAAGADELDQSVIIDKNAIWMNISDFGMVFLEFRTSSNHIVEQIP